MREVSLPPSSPLHLCVETHTCQARSQLGAWAHSVYKQWTPHMLLSLLPSTVSTHPLTRTPLLLHTSSPCAHTLHTCTYTHPTHVLVSRCSPSRRRSHTHCHAHTPPRHLLTPSGSGTPSHATSMLIHTQASQDAGCRGTFTPLVPLFTGSCLRYTPSRAVAHPCTRVSSLHMLTCVHAPRSHAYVCERLHSAPSGAVCTLPHLLPCPLLCARSSHSCITLTAIRSQPRRRRRRSLRRCGCAPGLTNQQPPRASNDYNCSQARGCQATLLCGQGWGQWGVTRAVSGY